MSPIAVFGLCVTIVGLGFFVLGYLFGRDRAVDKTLRETLRPRDWTRDPPGAHETSLILHPQVIGIFGALADAGLTSAGIASYMRHPRSELDGYTPRQALVIGGGYAQRALALAHEDLKRNEQELAAARGEDGTIS